MPGEIAPEVGARQSFEYLAAGVDAPVEAGSGSPIEQEISLMTTAARHAIVCYEIVTIVRDLRTPRVHNTASFHVFR